MYKILACYLIDSFPIFFSSSFLSFTLLLCSSKKHTKGRRLIKIRHI